MARIGRRSDTVSGSLMLLLSVHLPIAAPSLTLPVQNKRNHEACDVTIDVEPSHYQHPMPLAAI